MNKTILITGASTGIGRETAVFFAEKGWNVAATMRTIEKGKDLLKYPNLKTLSLDVVDETSIQKAIVDTITFFGQIDVLFNNAGYALFGAFEAMSGEQIKHQFETNVFGAMNVTKAILPHFRAKQNGTIITTTSVGGLISFPSASVYNSTKWALEGFLEGLQFELKQFNIKIKNIEPGGIRSEFENAMNFVSNEDYDSYTKITYKNMLDAYKTNPTAEIVGKKVWQAANDPSSRLRYAVGPQPSLLLFMRWLLPLSWLTKMISSLSEKGFKK